MFEPMKSWLYYEIAYLNKKKLENLLINQEKMFGKIIIESGNIQVAGECKTTV